MRHHFTINPISRMLSVLKQRSQSDLEVIGVPLIPSSCPSSSSPRTYSNNAPPDDIKAEPDNNDAVKAEPVEEHTTAAASGGEEEEAEVVTGEAAGLKARRRKPVSLTIACPVCGGPAPDHIHFGGEERALGIGILSYSQL